MKRSALLLPLLVLPLALAGCAGDNQERYPIAEGTQAASDEALLVALEEVAPGLGSQDSVADKDATCEDLDAGLDAEEIDRNALDRFSDQAEEELTMEQASTIVRVISSGYCGDQE